MMYRRFGKRLIDVTVAVGAVTIAMPVFLLVGLVIRWRLGSPMIFRQVRPGQDGHLFTLYKFRTMSDKRDKDGNQLDDAQRTTRVGRFARSTSLDELPGLWNVIRGDMSLIGPRPLLPEYLDRYTSEQKRRHEIRPGITGWAQVNGRNELDWKTRFEFDVWYVDHLGIWLDAKILLLTVVRVLRREGISEKGHISMSQFQSTKKGIPAIPSENKLKKRSA